MPGSTGRRAASAPSIVGRSAPGADYFLVITLPPSRPAHSARAASPGAASCPATSSGTRRPAPVPSRAERVELLPHFQQRDDRREGDALIEPGRIARVAQVVEGHGVPLGVEAWRAGGAWLGVGAVP